MYLLDRNEDKTITTLQDVVQNQSRYVRLHEDNKNYAAFVLQELKDGELQNPDKFAGEYKPGTIVWAKNGKLLHPARVNQILLSCLTLLHVSV